METNYAFSEEQIRQLGGCLASPEYFIENFCWLQQKASAGVSETSSTIPFQMGKKKGDDFYFQRRILRWLHNRENILALKSRRVGCSWIVAAYVAWLVNFHKSVNDVLISRNGTEAKKLLGKVKFILKNLKYHDSGDIRKATDASFLRGYFHAETQQLLEIGWRNDEGEVVEQSSVESITTTDDAGRGDDITFLTFDELPFYEHPEETWSSAQKALTRGGHWIAIGTAGPIGDVFHRLCSRGELDEADELDELLGYKYIKIHWSEAGITPEQVKAASIGSTQVMIDQEWEMKFIAPGTVVFDPTALAACYKPPDQYPEVAAELAAYREQVLHGNGGKVYCSGVDTIEGKAHKRSHQKDWNAWVSLTQSNVMACSHVDQSPISRWAGKTIDNAAGGRVEIVGKTSKLHEEFPGPVGIENTGPGLTTSTNHQLPKDSFSEQRGIDMSAAMKRGIITRLMLKVEAVGITITSLAAYQQMSVYQNLDGRGKYGAPPGFNDDIVMAIAIASDEVDKKGQLHFIFGKDVNTSQRVDGSTERQGAVRLRGGPIINLDIHPEHKRRIDQMGGVVIVDTSPLRETDRLFRQLIEKEHENLPTR